MAAEDHAPRTKPHADKTKKRKKPKKDKWGQPISAAADAEEPLAEPEQEPPAVAVAAEGCELSKVACRTRPQRRRSGSYSSGTAQSNRCSSLASPILANSVASLSSASRSVPTMLLITLCSLDSAHESLYVSFFPPTAVSELLALFIGTVTSPEQSV
jgi:hypothetical protein